MALLLLSVAGFPSSCSSAHFWCIASENGDGNATILGKKIPSFQSLYACLRWFLMYARKGENVNWGIETHLLNKL